MQPCRIVIRPALPQKSKLFRHPDSLLAWAVHPLDGKACLRTQSTLPATACTPALHATRPFERLEKHWDEAKALKIPKNTSG